MKMLDTNILEVCYSLWNN